MTIIHQFVDLKVSTSHELLASSFELIVSENRLVARGLQLVALDLMQSYNSSRSK
jgi:hypothetical protein